MLKQKPSFLYFLPLRSIPNSYRTCSVCWTKLLIREFSYHLLFEYIFNPFATYLNQYYCKERSHKYTKSFIIVNDIKNFVFSTAKAPVYGFGRNRKQKYVMSFTILTSEHKEGLEKLVKSVMAPAIINILFKLLISMLLNSCVTYLHSTTDNKCLLMIFINHPSKLYINYTLMYFKIALMSSEIIHTIHPSITSSRTSRNDVLSYISTADPANRLK